MTVGFEDLKEPKKGNKIHSIRLGKPKENHTDPEKLLRWKGVESSNRI